MRHVAWTLMLTMGACAKNAAVDIGMAGSSPMDIEPKFVELQHEDEGWIRVDLAPVAEPVGGEEGAVILGSADLPKGRYEALRLVYRATPGDPQVEDRGAAVGGGTHAARPEVGDGEPQSGERDAATFWQPFCIRGKEERIVLRVLPVNPMSGGTLQVDVRAPEC